MTGIRMVIEGAGNFTELIRNIADAMPQAVADGINQTTMDILSQVTDEEPRKAHYQDVGDTFHHPIQGKSRFMEDPFNAHIEELYQNIENAMVKLMNGET
jgi:hypothetical protein